MDRTELVLVLILLLVIAGGITYREYWAGMPPLKPIDIRPQPVPTPIRNGGGESASDVQNVTEPGRLDLNRVSVWELKTELDIDRTLAEQIVAYRERLGGRFDDPRRLLEIPAVTPDRYCLWAPRLYVGDRTDRDERTREPLDLNRASKPELESVPGIGSVLADRILDARNRAGRFGSWDDVMAIEGIGLDRLDRLKARFILDSTHEIELDNR